MKQGFLRAMAACLLASCLAQPAAAAVVIVPVSPFIPYEPYYIRPEPYMQVGEKYYELNLGGLVRLCRSQPELCAGAELQDELSSLKSRRIAGITLLVTGIAAAVGGTIWTGSTTHYDDFGYVSSAHYTPLIVGLSMGVVLPIVGGLVMPHPGDIVDYVNHANAAHGQIPIQLNLGLRDATSPSLALSLRF